MKGLNLKVMSIDELLELRDRITETLSSRVETERRELELRLARLQNFKSTVPQKSSARRGGFKKVGKLAPKYRNPTNRSETWAGRGLKPRWLSAAMKKGKKLSDFEISHGAKGSPRARRRRRVAAA
jgi:DNA-binding protein H-NS